jgi:hypothetical protein
MSILVRGSVPPAFDDTYGGAGGGGGGGDGGGGGGGVGGDGEGEEEGRGVSGVSRLSARRRHSFSRQSCTLPLSGAFV